MARGLWVVVALRPLLTTYLTDHNRSLPAYNHCPEERHSQHLAGLPPNARPHPPFCQRPTRTKSAAPPSPSPFPPSFAKRSSLTGTKIVCAEGDCGSCTVLLGRPISDTALDTRPVCSCIQYLGQLDCTHILTIEGLTPAGGLNAVQQSFVRHHGAQCGFCTPGFVVSTCAVLDRNPRATETELRRGLVGNLCRCNRLRAHPQSRS